MEIKAEHELFIEHFLECGDVKEAAEKAGFDRKSGKQLFKKLKERIQNALEDEMVMSQVQAMKVVKDTMGVKAVEPKQEIRLRAAQDVLDRGGLTKKTSIDLGGSALPAVMVLPAKDPAPANGVNE